MTLKMTTAQVVERSVTVTKCSFQNYTHPHDHTTQTTDTPGFKPINLLVEIACVAGARRWKGKGNSREAQKRARAPRVGGRGSAQAPDFPYSPSPSSAYHTG